MYARLFLDNNSQGGMNCKCADPDDLRLDFLRHWRREELPLQIDVMRFENANSKRYELMARISLEQSSAHPKG